MIKSTSLLKIHKSILKFSIFPQPITFLTLLYTRLYPRTLVAAQQYFYLCYIYIFFPITLTKHNLIKIPS
jgi:hypothetical protein